MRRHNDPIRGEDAVSAEFTEVWEELRRVKQMIGPSVLPEGFTWTQSGDTLIVISPSGAQTPIT